MSIIPAVVREVTGETINAIDVTGDREEVYLTQEDYVYDKPQSVVIQIDKAQWPALRDLIDRCFNAK